MKVKFLPQDVEFDIEPGQSVLDLAHKNNIPIHSTCNGMPSCAECRVIVVEGDYNLIPPSKKEMSLIGTGYYIDGRRLSCQMSCFGDVVVNVQEHLDRESSGHMTKKFLSRVQKDSAEESHSVGDVLIQKDNRLFEELGSTVDEDTTESRDHEMFDQMLKGGSSKKSSGNRNRSRSGGGGQKGSSKSGSGPGGSAQNRSAQGGGENRQASPSSADGKSQDQSGPKKSGRSRNRNRNRNRNRHREDKGKGQG